MTSTLPPLVQAVIQAIDGLGVPVSTEVPPARPSSFIRVTATGGPTRNIVQVDPTFLVECWAASSVAAETLARAAWTVLANTRGTSLGDGAAWVAQSVVTLPVDYPDARTGSPRFQFLYQPTLNLLEAG